MSKSCGGACGGDATSAADTDIQASSEAPGRWVSVYAVPKMDCPSEERMIRLALNGFEEIRALSFDLSNRRLKVVHDGEVEPVTSKLKTLGLGASLQETVAANPETIKAAEFSAASAKQESGTLRWLLGINALLFVVEMTAGLIAQSIQKESLVAQLREANAALIAHSYTDALTGLPNRRAIFENVETLFSLARHLRQKIVVAYIDLDDFKLINDRFGHEVGDQFLIQIGQRLLRECSDNDILGRLGGDEFLVVRLSAEDELDQLMRLQQVKNQLQQQICGDYHLGDIHLYYPGASLGVVEIDPLETDVNCALHLADSAMYQDKKRQDKTPFVVH